MEIVRSLVAFHCLLISSVLPNPDERKLFDELFENYSIDVRPVKDGSTLFIDMTYYIVALNSINEKNQVASFFGWLRTYWTDEYLTWDKKRYPFDLVVDANKVWLPDLIVRNSADNIYGELFKEGKDDNDKVVLRSDGRIAYATAGTSSTLCNLDMTYFPFDIQVCFIHIGSWTYSISQMKIRRIMDKINVTSFSQNGIWELIDTHVSDTVEDSSQIRFIMYWRRYPAYHLASLVLPCSMMSFVTLFVFLLPPDSGEKIGLSITTLLSFTVFQISVEEKMPERSDNRPLITIYILGVMMLTALSLLCTVIVLMLHHQKSDDPPPRWLKILVLDWLGKIFFKKNGIVYGSGRVESFIRKRLSVASGMESCAQEGSEILSGKSLRKRSITQVNHESRLESDDPDVNMTVPESLEMSENDGAILSVNEASIPDITTPRKLSISSIFKLKKHRKSETPSITNPASSPNDCVKAILKKMMDDANSEEFKTQWMRIALVCDRFFGILFTFSLFVLTATIFGILSNPPGLEAASKRAR